MPEFKKYNKDAITALLTKREYTLEEAREVLKEYFKR